MTLAADPHTPLSPATLRSFVTAMAGKRVLVVGDVMLDRFIEGEVLRISPESPVPVLSARRKTAMLGGAGNVVANLCGLGIRARLVAIVGEDEEAGAIRRLLQDQGCDIAALLGASDRPSIVKTRFLASGQHLLRLDEEKILPVSGALEAKIIEEALRALDEADAVILSDYAKGVLTPTVLGAVIEAAKARNLPVLVDPKAKDYGVYRGADIIKPNRKELAEASGMKVNEDEEVTKAARHLIEKAGIGAVLATRAQQGMSVIRADGTPPSHLKTTAREVFDVSGAGDTVISTLAAALVAGANLEQAAVLANHAAGIVVGKSGTAPITAEALSADLQNPAPLATPGGEAAEPFQAALVPLDAAVEQVGRWKAQGLKVGFTNGCFDILHAGHVRYLNMARARCDRLVVAINADESVRRLKGPSRPVNDAESRGCVLGALASVDLVLAFGETPQEQDTPLEVIRALSPDLLVKGQDYTVETVVGADYVISQGGEVWLAPLEEGKSTTATLRKISGTA